MIDIQKLNISLGRKQILKDVTFSFENDVYVLLGPNGAGKTTLFRCIAGIYTRYKGKIIFSGNKIGYLPQKFGVYHNLTVRETLDYLALLKETDNRRDEVDKCIHMLHLEEYADVKAKKLSGGTLRRLGIAQALLGEPDVLLLDEPTAGLDPKERRDFFNNLKDLSYQGTLLISTHILDDVKRIAKEAVVMNGGSILSPTLTDFGTLLEEKYLCLIEKDS